MKTLRTDQASAIDNLRAAFADRERRMVLQAPTGFGKTVVAADIVRNARGKNKTVLVTVPALSLVEQTVEALWSHGIKDIGVIQAQHMMTDASKPVQVASVQTLQNRWEEVRPTDVVIVDECHRWFSFFRSWFSAEAWRRVPFIGLSATPWLESLGQYFDKLVIGNTIAQMIADKTLSPYRVFAAGHPDLEGVPVRRNSHGERDYVEADLVERMNRPKLVADVVQSWKNLGEDRPTICFAVNRDHAAQLAKEFEQAGVPSAYMDCDTKQPDWRDRDGNLYDGRKTIRKKFLRGDVRVVVNVDVIGLGVDWPEVSCIVYARPTQSEMRYVQNIGRGLRASEGKADLIVIDHSDTTLRLGFVSDIHHDELHNGQPKINGARPIERPNECPKCHYIKPARTAKCSACGYVTEHHARPIVVQAGTLKELKPEDVAKPAPVAKKFPDKAKTYGQLLWYSRKHGYSPDNDGWAKHKYRAIYGVWPQPNMLQWRLHFRSPEMDLASWIKSTFIRHAKASGRWRDDNIQDERPKGAVASVNGFAKRSPETLMTETDWEEFR